MRKFQAKISYLKQTENGSVIKKSDEYLVSAYTFTEAEANLQQFLQDYISDYDLIKLAISNINDVVLPSGDEVLTYWKCRLAYVTYDEESGKEKKVSEYLLINAQNTVEATEIIEKRMEGSIVDWEIIQISETNIIDVI